MRPWRASLGRSSSPPGPARRRVRKQQEGGEEDAGQRRGGTAGGDTEFGFEGHAEIEQQSSSNKPAHREMPWVAPVRGTRPKVGRRPAAPQRWLGEVIEPRVSLPMPKPTSPAAVAEAEPALEPLDPSRRAPFSLESVPGTACSLG